MPAAPSPHVDKARWPVLSPLLDQLLDLDPSARPARLAALRTDDPALADELAGLLDRLAALDDTRFLDAPALPAPTGPDSAAGQQVGAYHLAREIGRGGMGSVWLARRTDGRFEGQVAIKFLQAELFNRFGPTVGARFTREGRILGRLAHPNIARLLDAGHLGGEGPTPVQPYLVLEYVEGEPIDQFCERQSLDVPARLRLFGDVLAAVAHAHNRLILHRDLKPSNILVTAAGEVKLLDFGIAKLLDAAEDPGTASELTQRAGQAFTPQYAAPEQLQGGDVTTATDVYALGVLLYQLLSGQHPTGAADDAPLQRLQAVVQFQPPRLSDAVLKAGGPQAARRARALRGDLDTIVARALKKRPAERYANAADLADDLRRTLAHEPIAARPDTWAYRSGKFLRRHRVAVVAGTLAAVALTATAGVAWREALQAQQQQAQAESLIEFMLGDLPGKLKPVGRLDALDAVGDRALAYYAAQSPARLDAASLGRRARALHLIGEIDEQRGRLDEAASRFGAAFEATGELLAREPASPEHLFNHSQSAYWVGFIARRRGQRDEAEAAWQAYQTLARQGASLQPERADWRIEIAYAGQNLGVLQLESARPADALRAFEQTLQAWRSVLDAQPRMALELGNTLGWIAKAHEAQQDHAAAIAAQRAKIDALERLPDAARDREAQYLVANALYEIGRLSQALGRHDVAAEHAQQALSRFQDLVRLDADNLDWLSQLAWARVSLAEAHAGTALARDQLAPLQAIVERLMAQPAPKVRWAINLRGRVLGLLAADDRDGAAPAVAAYLADVARHEADGKPLDPEQAAIVDVLRAGWGTATADR